ncbi:MAG: uracil-DNA glycosylase [Oscillospiraceae bacterium]
MNLENFKDTLSTCTDCALCENRTQIVFGEGGDNAKIMLVGEAPGKNEDLQGLPFIGKSGKLLDDMLATVGLFRGENVYITSICKCRPPENRDPKPAERNACLVHLQKQIEIINPKIVVCLGRIAALCLIDKKFSVTAHHGEFIEKDGRLYTATLHPAAVLRNINNRPIVENDFMKIKNLL